MCESIKKHLLLFRTRERELLSKSEGLYEHTVGGFRDFLTLLPQNKIKQKYDHLSEIERSRTFLTHT